MGKAISTIVSVATLGLVPAIQGNSEQKKAAKAMQQAADSQRKAEGERLAQQAQQNQEQTRRQVREERIRRAEILQGAENAGAAGSTGEFGGIGSVATQLGSGLGFAFGQAASVDRQSNLNTQAGMYQSQANKYMSNAQQYSSLSSIGSSLGMLGLGAMGGFSGIGQSFNSIFSGGTAASTGTANFKPTSTIGFTGTGSTGFRL